MHTMKSAAEMIGVQVATLRAWERRYKIVAPLSAVAGHRLYDDEAVRAFGTMNSLVLEGWSPKEAAEETRRRLDAEATRLIGGPDEPADPGEELLRAAARLDVAGVTRVLDAQLDTASVGVTSLETAIDDWLLPTLRRLGLAWASGRVSVAGEHMVTHAVVRQLWAAYEAAEPAKSAAAGPHVMIGLPPSSRHELGLLAFAVAARRAGLTTTYLGADLPAADWVTAVEARRPSALVLAASMKLDLDHVESVVESVGAAHPDLLIAVGGAFQERTHSGAVRLGHRVGDAAAALHARLATP